MTIGMKKREMTLSHKISRDWKMNKYKYLLILPVLVYLALFCYKPMYGLIIAFNNYKPTRGITGSDSWCSARAGVAGSDQDAYVAARIVGAYRFQQMLHITIPGILPTIMILFVLRMGSILNVGYEKVLLLYTENTYNVADVFSTFTYHEAL